MNYTEKLPTEDEHTEYKKAQKAFPKDAWESISAFENTDGGLIILGITEDSNHNFHISGVLDSQAICDEFWAAINNNMVSNHNFTNEDIKTVTVEGKTIIEITVHEAEDKFKPVYVKRDIHQTFVRNGTTDHKADSDTIKLLMRASSNSLDTEVIKNYGIDDLEISDINQYREKLQARESYQLYERFSLEDFLTRIGVLTKDYARDGRLGVTVGGLLFFGKNNAILHTFPNFQLDYYDKRSLQQERWSKRISSIEDNLNIFSFYKKTDDALMATIENRFELNDQGERIDTFGSMHVALREGLINMLMHADYSGETPVILNNTTNYFEFINPGKMKIPSKDFFTTSKTSTRNPIISKLFIQIGIGERAGHGGEKIYECALINKFKFPEINTDLTHTTLKIWKVDLANSFSGKQITDRERLVLNALVSQSHSLTHKELENITHLSRSITSTTIANLLQKDLIKRYGKTKSTKYGIQPTTEQVLAQAQTIPDLVRSILNIHADH